MISKDSYKVFLQIVAVDQVRPIETTKWNLFSVNHEFIEIIGVLTLLL